ncbi:MAG: hypothetical protein E7316_10870 [Clostridiales bacterium]|nr:hypothetical protein [Clostridiales bacterium]
MFLRKLTVIVAPLLLALLMCLLLPLLDNLGFWSSVLKGLLLGVTLALLLPVSGAGRRREPFAGLLWIPALILALVVTYQYLQGMGMVNLPVLKMLATSKGQVVLVECAFIGYMATQCIRTRK